MSSKEMVSKEISSTEIRKLKKKLREIELLKSKDILNDEQLIKLCKENEIKNKLQELEVLFEFNQSKNPGIFIPKSEEEPVKSKSKLKSKSKNRKKNTCDSEEEDDMALLEKYKYSKDNQLWTDYNDNQVIKNDKKKRKAQMNKKQDEIKLEAYFKYKSSENL